MTSTAPMDTRRGDALNAFRIANPSYWRKVDGDLERTTQIRTALERASEVRKALERHFSIHGRSWFSRELASMMAERAAPNFRHPAPTWSAGFDHRSVREEAGRRVTARLEARLVRLDQIGERMARRIACGRDVVRRTTRPLKEDVYETVQRARILRRECQRRADHARERCSDRTAQEAGQPIRQDYQLHQKRLAQLNRAERSVIEQAFRRHGVELPKHSQTRPHGPSRTR